MNTKAKGDISVAKAIFEFLKREIPISIPFGDNQRYDIIAEFHGKLQKVQVKTANEIQNGSIVCYARSSTNHTTNKHLTTYENEVDYFVFYNQDLDLIALVPIEIFQGQAQKNFRLTPPQSINQYSIVYFADYSFDKIINRE